MVGWYLGYLWKGELFDVVEWVWGCLVDDFVGSVDPIDVPMSLVDFTVRGWVILVLFGIMLGVYFLWG